jgi:dephospho-CoA kinase
MIVGLAGSFAAGKGTVVDYLVKTHNFKHFSASGFITEEIIKRGLPVNRDSMIIVANDLRATHGPTYIVDELYKQAQQYEGNAVIESLRAVAEVKHIQKLGGVVIGVDAEPEIRYQRAIGRGGVKDNVSYEEWKAQELAECNPDDETKQNIFGALALADYIIKNSADKKTLALEVEKFINSLSV